MIEINWPDFEKIDIRTGTIVEVSDFPEANNASYKLKIFFGEEIGFKTTSAQITSFYNKEELLNKQVVAVLNFPKKQIANFMSECLVLGAIDGKDVTLLNLERSIKNGLKIG